MSEWMLYLFIKLDSIITLSKFVMVPCFVITIGLIIFWIVLWIIPFYYALEDEYGSPPDPVDVLNVKAQCKGLRKAPRKLLLWLVPILIIFSLIRHMVPTTNEMFVIYVVPKILNNENVKKIPGKMFKVAETWMEAEITKIKKETLK